MNQEQFKVMKYLSENLPIWSDGYYTQHSAYKLQIGKVQFGGIVENTMFPLLVISIDDEIIIEINSYFIISDDMFTLEDYVKEYKLRASKEDIFNGSLSDEDYHKFSYEDLQIFIKIYESYKIYRGLTQR